MSNGKNTRFQLVAKSMGVRELGENRKEDRQIDRFVETARKLGCDEDEAAFDEKLRRIAKPKPEQGRKSETKKPGR